MKNKKFSTPARILIIRHAEKPPVNMESDELSAKGFERAQALTQLFINQPELVTYGTPVAFYAAAYVPGKTSNRCPQTLHLLSSSYHQALRTDYEAKEYKELAEEILNEPHYFGKTVMICWSHQYMEELVEALGGFAPGPWSGQVFDRIWILDFEGDSKPKFRDVRQRLQNERALSASL
jgi:hypothetical protein